MMIPELPAASYFAEGWSDLDLIDGGGGQAFEIAGQLRGREIGACYRS